MNIADLYIGSLQTRSKEKLRSLKLVSHSKTVVFKQVHCEGDKVRFHTDFPQPPGQYCWSIIMGFSTLFIKISWKTMDEALLGVFPDGHDLILIPFSVPVRVQFFTVIPNTSSSLSYFPKLPTLFEDIETFWS